MIKMAQEMGRAGRPRGAGAVATWVATVWGGHLRGGIDGRGRTPPCAGDTRSSLSVISLRA